MWSRRAWGQGCLSAVTTAAGAPLWAQSGSNPLSVTSRQVSIGVDSKASFCYLPLTVAERLGYFVAEGLVVDIQEAESAARAWASLQNGTTQVVVGSYSEALQRFAQGQPFQSLVLLGRAPQLVLGVSQQTMKDYRRVVDLRGKRLGVTGMGSASHRVAKLVLAKSGMGANELQVQALPNAAEALHAFESGRIDAICYSDPTITRLEQAGRLRVVADTRTVQGSAAVFGGPMPTACLMAPEKFSQDRADSCQALTNALVRALKWLQTAGPSDIIKVMPEAYFGGDRALYLAAFNSARGGWAADGMMPADGPPTASRSLVQTHEGSPISRPELARTFTNSFALKAKARYRV